MKSRPNYIPALLAALALSAPAVVGGCGIYKINVQQGNFFKDETLSQLKVGMTRRQVRFLLGSPMIADSFHPDRWDYVFHFRNGRTGETSQRNVTVWFDGDAVERIDLPEDYSPPSA